MAKKSSMNILEAHLEKIVLVLSLGFFGWVLFVFYINPPGVKVDQETLSVSEVTGRGADKAEEIVRQMALPDTRTLPVVQLSAGDLFGRVQPFVSSAIPPLNPIVMMDTSGIEEERLYRVPEIPTLTDVSIELNSEVAFVPSSESAEPEQEDWQEKDVDFVTVSAIFSMAKLYESFEKSFGPGVAKPLEQSEPVVAVVQLQRRQLSPDGAWSEYEDVSRLKVDPVADIELTPQAIHELTQTTFQVLLKDRHDYNTQVDIIQPVSYELLDGEWLSPVEKERLKEEGGDRRSRAGTGRRSRSGATSRRQGRSPKGGTGRMGLGDFMDPGMGLPPGLDMGFGMNTRQGTGRRRGGRGSSSRRSTSNRETRPEQLSNEKAHLWAHDGSVKPGGIYSYRFRVGFFNPIAGHNWFTESQSNLRDQRILWSPAAVSEKIVKVPKRTFFFPKTTFGEMAVASVRLEVCRKQEGRWHKKLFRVAPGSEIGAVVSEKIASDGLDARSAMERETLEIDYRTGVTIIDVVPECRHWAIKSIYAKPISCSDIIYRDSDGAVKRLPTHKNAWPEELVKIYNSINKEIKDLEKQTGRQPGRRQPGRR